MIITSSRAAPGARVDSLSDFDNAWSIQPGVYGRGLERLLPPDISAELMESWVGPGTGRSWDALFRTTALFRRVALEVGTALGYAYPAHVDHRITAHLKAVRRLLPAGNA
jgi:aminoglycoside 6-adenylyltransferase